MKLVSGNLRYSSWSVRAWTAVQLSQLPCTIEVLPLFTPETNARLAAESPNRKSPYLIDGAVTVWDSLAIGEYLSEHAPHLWPVDAAARAMARSVCAQMHSGFQALRQHCTMNTGRHYPGYALTPEARADVDMIEALWQLCRTRFAASGDFLFGDFTLADCFYAPVVSRFCTYDVALCDESRRYIAAMKAHPIIMDWYAQAAEESWRIDSYEH